MKKKLTDYNALLLSSVPELEDAAQYSLVWQDEFNEPLNVYNDLDENWQFQYCSGWANDLKLTRDTVAVKYDNQNSYLSLRTVKTGETVTSESGVTYNVYNTPVPLTTCGKMSYLYGYLEIRANVPYGQGIYPALWLKSTNAQYRDSETETFVGDPKLGYVESALYETEVDVFEVFGNSKLSPNIHKWWKTISETYQYKKNNGLGSGEQYTAGCSVSQYDITFGEPYSITKQQWHTYGFEWTPEKMAMYVDGKIYQTFDLTVNFGSDENGYGMQGFKESPLSVILSLKAYTQGAVDEQNWAVSRTPIDDTAYNPGDIVSEFDIDYIRLYQKSDGKIWTRY